MSMNLSFHGVTSIRLEDVTHNGRTWARLFIADNRGGQTVELTLFPADPDEPLRVDQPEPYPDEDDEPSAPYRDSLGHTESQRQDIRDAGRGHLLP